jgi:hypothetical protein
MQHPEVGACLFVQHLEVLFVPLRVLILAFTKLLPLFLRFIIIVIVAFVPVVTELLARFDHCRGGGGNVRVLSLKKSLSSHQLVTPYWVCPGEEEGVGCK